MNNPPLVSIVVPVFNAEMFLEATLASILAQTFSDFEVIVVDDGSTDRSPDIADEFSRRDDRFRVMRQANSGVGPTRQNGIGKARGRWIALCDADDMWEPQKLEKQMEYISKSDLHMVAVGSQGYHVNIKGRIVGKFDPGMRAVSEFCRRRDDCKVIYMLNSSVVFDREAYLECGGTRQEYAPAEDVDLWTRMAQFGTMINLPEPLVYYRIHGASASDKGYMRQMVNTERIQTNCTRRRDGLPELSYEEFSHWMSAPENAARYREKQRQWKSQYFYRQGATLITNGQFLRGCLMMMRSLLQNPLLPLRRLRKQFTGRVIRGSN